MCESQFEAWVIATCIFEEKSCVDAIQGKFKFVLDETRIDGKLDSRSDFQSRKVEEKKLIVKYKRFSKCCQNYNQLMCDFYLFTKILFVS